MQPADENCGLSTPFGSPMVPPTAATDNDDIKEKLQLLLNCLQPTQMPFPFFIPTNPPTQNNPFMQFSFTPFLPFPTTTIFPTISAAPQMVTPTPPPSIMAPSPFSCVPSNFLSTPLPPTVAPTTASWMPPTPLQFSPILASMMNSTFGMLPPPAVSSIGRMPRKSFTKQRQPLPYAGKKENAWKKMELDKVHRDFLKTEVKKFLENGIQAALSEIFEFSEGHSLRHRDVAEMAEIKHGMFGKIKNYASDPNNNRDQIPPEDIEKLINWYLVCTNFPSSFPSILEPVEGHEEEFQFKNELKTKQKKRPRKRRTIPLKQSSQVTPFDGFDFIPTEMLSSFQNLHLSGR